MRLVAHSDASYGNLKGGGSPSGFIVFISDKDRFCSPIAWASKRIKRVVRSTLSAETLAAVDADYLISKILAEEKRRRYPLICTRIIRAYMML